ncbi:MULTISPECIES: MaoC family dehydratase [Cycloclasticus]|uniref:Monoamine oxidase regulatory protein n=1 Tax=Cycloclasticus pugetii TaxID=34068 RepID=A0AB33Z2H8_9GAMM|nr:MULTISPECIES: MaoC family dehydratase [Cycloclasticus]ATI03165.1 transcriptional regulator [Cycloclasticus sp. PY97N]EPD13442.1 Monoamine oxidase regulatory protein [Cycloclasticus pugetii]|tara:strand:+ start:3518 stop:3943 length:426 start_codon:yes stop_codon:yes gene_type:complete
MSELKSYEGYCVGASIGELTQAVDQSMIDAYADASGDINPLHIDPEFAKTTFFGRTIAHGLLTLAFVSRVLSAWNWQGWAYGGELNVSFLGPVYPGDTVCVSGDIEQIEKREDGVYARCQLACFCGERTVLKGFVISKISK